MRKQHAVILVILVLGVGGAIGLVSLAGWERSTKQFDVPGCIKPPPVGDGTLDEASRLSLEAELEGIPNVAAAAGGVKSEVLRTTELRYAELDDDETVLYMLLKAIECYAEGDVISQQVREELARDVFLRYLDAVGQAGGDDLELPEVTRGRIVTQLEGSSDYVLEQLQVVGVQ